MNNSVLDTMKLAALQDELDTSVKLIKAGFGELQEIDMDNDFYHLPHQLLASGFERLMKCYIMLVYAGRNGGKYPNVQFLKTLGHNLVHLLHTINHDYYGGTNRPLVREELEFLKTDKILGECMRVLSLFGKKGRYYNLDFVAGGNSSPISTDPKQEWESLENEIEDPAPYLSTDAFYTEYFPRVNQKLVAKMERLGRAIALQFTIGDHQDPKRHLSILSVSVSEFIHLRSFGTNDYRKSVRLLQQEKDNWEEYSDFDIANSPWPTCTATREGFHGDWPFRVDRVILECRGRMFRIVYADGYAFALNGAARTRFGYPDVHAAGVAIIGKSVGPFLDMAQDLCK